jgi:hypothetical protein
MSNLKKRYLVYLSCFLFLVVLSVHFSTNKGIELGTTKAEAAIQQTCDCPNGEVKGSGNYDWGAVWQFCDNCETVTNREASDQECSCSDPVKD